MWGNVGLGITSLRERESREIISGAFFPSSFSSNSLGAALT